MRTDLSDTCNISSIYVKVKSFSYFYTNYVYIIKFLVKKEGLGCEWSMSAREAREEKSHRPSDECDVMRIVFLGEKGKGWQVRTQEYQQD